jgi:hypothetical protein
MALSWAVILITVFDEFPPIFLKYFLSVWNERHGIISERRLDTTIRVVRG